LGPMFNFPTGPCNKDSLMPRWRRLNQSSDAFPIAAEVLEVRSYLSSAAAIAHSAVVHVEHQLSPHSSVHAKASTPVVTFPASQLFTAGGQITFNGGTFSLPPLGFDFPLTKASGQVKVGGKVSMPVNHTYNSVGGGAGVTALTLKGSFGGKVDHIDGLPGVSSNLHLTKTSSLTLTMTINGQKVSGKLVGDTTTLPTLSIGGQNQFGIFLGTYHFSGPKGLAGTMNVEIATI
jgi:hypothetical protein